MNLITWNPSDKGSNISLSNNNLTATANSITSCLSNGCRANYAIPSGKWYWEVYFSTTSYQLVGIATKDVVNMNMAQISTRTGIRAYESMRGYKLNDSSAQNPYTTADTSANQCIGIAIDTINGTVAFYKNGVFLGIAFTDISSLGTIYPFIGLYYSSSATINLGSSIFKYPIPNGYLPLEPNTIYARIKTSISDIKNIGDIISCRYTALTSGQVGTFSELGTTTSTLIPAASSATPDGSFYWVYVGKDYLGRKKFIADRNIQNNISWDILNTNGFINENKINLAQYSNSLVPILSGNVASYGTASTNSIYNTTYDAWKAFDGSISTMYASAIISSIQLSYKFTNSKIINSYKLTSANDSGNAGIMIKNWTFEGSNDGTTWTILDTRTNEINWGVSESRIYDTSNTTTYLYYRINSNSYNGTIGRCTICELGLLQKYQVSNINQSNNLFIRLLSGGTSSTDTDNEWDQIIANSTLNNTIIAGDNNVWNWNGIYSLTSTSYTTNTNRIIRGNGTVSTFVQNTSTFVSALYGFRPVMLIQLASIPTFSGNLLSSSVHNQDAILTGTISNLDGSTNKIQYKILLNDIQIYPTSGYTDFAISPNSINYTISNSLLINMNNKITIAMNNEINKTSIQDYYVTLYNNVPNGILTLSNITTHNTNIELTGNITDTDLDQISYKILINGTEMLPWSTFTTDPYIDYTINANDLIIGSNTIEVDYKDNFKNVGLGSWTNTITKTNNPPIINIQYINGSIIGTITDPDSDLTQYRILINGTQKYPETMDYTDLKLVNNINYQINRNDILIGKNNIITVFAKDSLNSVIGQEISFIGDYVGLMFMDEQKQFYTTDIGELLQYLDFGIITLGQITEPVKILVQNKYGFSIKDINLYVQNSLPNVNIELSKEENPFISTDNLVLNNTYKPNEIDYFYVRLNTAVSANSVSGEFKIYAKATPLS